MRYGVISDPCLVESDGFAVEEVGQRFIGGRWIAERTGGQVNSAGEVFVQLAIKAETHTKTGAVAIKCSFLNEILATHPHISIEAEAANQAFERRHAVLLIRCA